MIRIGPAGWAYKDWAGIVYPEPKPRRFDPLAYLAGYFDTIEINSSYYGAPRAPSAKKWAESVRANERFRFTAKLFQSFTHARKPAPLDEKEFKDGIAPLVEASRLGALLIQFPWSFKNDAESREYVAKLCLAFREYPLVIEVRHSSWIDPAVLDVLGELGVGICNIDQPVFHRSVKPTALVTSTIGYVRLHGRNYKQWFSPTANVRDRYDHLYSTEELEPWLDRIKQISKDAKDTYVVANNHNLGKGPVNALEIRALLEDGCVPAPPTLLQHYAELRDVLDELPGAKRIALS
ncbi:MAG TPA: DUF72 domain-containing protein [Bryobacteraceae bacterium]|nr:DUF72 domain-containing protein [Bryobacteraceae bacterium]